MIDVVVCKSVAFVVVCVHSIVKNCDSAIWGKPEVSGGILNNWVYNGSFLMVVSDIKNSFFSILNSNCIVWRNTKPEGTAFILSYFVYRRIFDFCNACKSFDFFCCVKKEVVFDCSRNPDAAGCITVKTWNLNCVLAKFMKSIRNFYFALRG